MVRATTLNYQFMVAGYYDDFNGARAIPNDDNDPSLTTTYDHGKTHYGNPLNGEATLNTRYRWSYADRQQYDGTTTPTSDGVSVATSTTRYLKNRGPADWLTVDVSRQTPHKWEGRSQLQYPDSHNANKYRFNSNGSDGYLILCNGHDTTGSYYIPTGDHDSSFGRDERQPYTIQYYDDGTTTQESNAGKLDNSYKTGFSQRANLTGVWTGERNYGFSHFSTGGATETPRFHLTPHRSPSGMPFLCIQSFQSGTTSIVETSTKRPAIAYDGLLNSRQDGDTFGLRFAVQSLNLGQLAATDPNPPKMTIQVGFPSSLNPGTEKGYIENTNTAAIEWEIDLGIATAANNGLGGTYDFTNTMATWDGSAYNASSLWIDLEFVIDYTNNRFTVYKDGTAIKNTSGADGPFTMNNNADTSAAFLPSAMKGWQILLEPGTNPVNQSHFTLMLDRVGLYQSLTERADGTVLPPVSSMKMALPLNAISSMDITIDDDPGMNTGTGAVGLRDQDYTHFLTNIFKGNLVDWSMMMFVGGIDRPIWRGPFEKLSIKQGPKQRVLTLRAKDSLSVLDRQVPLWELGQLGENTDDGNAYWSDESSNYNTAFYLGASKLKTLKPTVGLDKDDSYAVRTDQRTQLFSSHPIQMYNNEDVDFGPNSIEEQYEGYSIVGFGQEAGSVGATVKTYVFLEGASLYSASDTITITNTASHNAASKAVNAINTYTYNGTKQRLDILSSALAFTRLAGVEWVYAGKYELKEKLGLAGSASAYTSCINGNYNFVFDANPGLKAGDVFFVPGNSHAFYHSGSTSTNYSDVSNQPLTVQSIKKVSRKWTQQTYIGSQSEGEIERESFSGLDDSPNDLYVVVTTKQYVTGTHNEYGAFTTNGGLTGDAKGVICKDTGIVNPITVEGLGSRAVHAKWMRDLPQSLWFQYHFGIINSTTDASGSLSANVAAGDTAVRIPQATYDAIGGNAGLAEIINSDGSADTFIWRAKATTGGNYYLIGCSFITQTHTTGDVINILTTKDDYKHCWVLWSDMRNDGRADADGSSRKVDFGILEPTIDNYEVELFYADQTDQNGSPDVFTDLALGKDVDLWEIDGTTDPSSGGAWSKPADFSTSAGAALADNSGALQLTVSASHGVVANDYIHIFNSLKHNGVYEVASVGATTITLGAGTYVAADAGGTAGARYCKVTGSEADLTVYHDWEDKAGAFLVVDSSKFFNMNTTVNGGKSGQNAGGRTDLEDYVTSGEGFPILVDNYWSEAMATYKTVADPFQQHPNQHRITSDASIADESIQQNDRHIRLSSGAEFPTAGKGRVIATKGSGATATRTDAYIMWEATNQTNYTGTASSVDNSASNITKIIDSSADFTALASDVNNGLYYPYIINSTQTKTGIVIAITTTGSTFDTLHIATASSMSAKTYGHFPNIPGFTAASSDAYIIPPQLINVFGSTLSTVQNLTDATPSTIETALDAERNYCAPPKRVLCPTMTKGSDTGQYETLTVYNSVSSQHMTRLMMRINGFVEAPNSGTYYESDKMRMVWNAGLMKTWLPRTRLSAMHDIANVPNTTVMTTDGTTNAGSQDAYGSVFDARTKTIYAIVAGSQQNSGVGKNQGLVQTFSFLSGRDGRIDMRPKYNSGYAFTRSNLMVSNMEADVAGRVSHVRVYYNNGMAFADYPTPNLGDTTRWQVVEQPGIVNKREALSIAKHTYEKAKESRLSITAEPILEGDETDKMMTGGRYGYIADTHRLLDHHDGVYGYDWAHIAAGFTPFPGMVNAMDGNLKTSTDIYHRYGQSAPYTSISASGAADIEYTDQYYFYGANSLSYAVQAVHIPENMPYVSDTSNNELRVFVTVTPGQSGTDIDTAQFNIILADYGFSNAKTANGYTSTTVGSFDATLAGSATNATSTITASNSGFYSLVVPQTYSSSLQAAGAAVVVSFNAEYCRALLRHRCGDPTDSNILKGAHALTGISTGVATGGNDNSIFPLGGRKYSEFGDFAYGRSEWYAPRLHVINDMKFVPGTFVTYTDKGLELDAEALVIQSLNWNISGRDVGKVNMKLERDESRSAGGILPYISGIGTNPRTGRSGSRAGVQVPTRGGGFRDIGGGEEERPPDTGNTPSEDHKQRPTVPPNSSNPPSSGTRGSGGSFNPQIGANNLTSGMHSAYKGRMDLVSDQFSQQGSFGILGQKKPNPTPGSIKPTSDNTQSFTPASGGATMTSEGITFPGVGHPDNTGDQSSSIESIVTVPADVLNNEINISATISCGGSGGDSKIASLSVTVTCEETNSSVTNTINIPTGTNNKILEILPTTLLSGASTYGNNITVTISRTPNTTADTALYEAIKIQGIFVGFKRSSFFTKGLGSEFKPFS